MATAADIIKGALRRIQVIEAETPITADEIQDGLEDLNDFGSQMEAGGLSLGFNQLSSTADEVSIPFQTVGMFKDNLAVYMAGQYGAPIAQTLAESADKSYRLALAAFQGPIDVSYSDSLPTGAGSDCFGVFYEENFFPANDEQNF